MKIRSTIKHLFPVLLAASVIGCGGGGSSSPDPDPGPTNPAPTDPAPTDPDPVDPDPVDPDPVDPDPVDPVPEMTDISVSQTAGTKDERLACYKANGEAACNLRMYQIMAESFIDGDASADYNTGYGNSHHKGDIAGITASLDYIKSLGVNAIWVTPLFYSNGGDARLNATGYFATDFFRIDPNFGTIEQAREMVEQAHAKGLYVFFDGVFGHYLSNVEASPGGLQPNPSGESVYPDDLEFFQEVASYWVEELKIDGWRVDQAYQVPAQYWDDLRESVETASASVTYENMAGEMVNPLGYMVAEVWRSASEIAAEAFGPEGTPALNSAFDFPVRYSVVQTFAVEESGASTGLASTLNSGFFNHLNYPTHAMPNLMLGNHDLVRFGDLLQRGDIAEPSDAEYWARHKAAMSFQAAYSGPITVYYGDEIGDEVPGFADQVANNICANLGQCDDHVARSSAKIEGVPTLTGDAPTTLNANQSDLKDYLTSLMTMRAANPALYNGSRTHIYSDSKVFVDRKDASDNNVLYIVNASDEHIALTVSAESIGSDGALNNLQDSADIIAITNDEYVLTLEPFEALFYDIVSAQELVSDSGPVSLTGEGPLADCTRADTMEDGPLGKEMFIRGTYDGGEGFAATPASRKFNYTGDNIYQVVLSEPTSTFTLKFASEDWSSEFAVAGAAPVSIGSSQPMAVAAGSGTESTIVVPEAGDYVYSFEINASNDGGTMMVSLCP